MKQDSVDLMHFRLITHGTVVLLHPEVSREGCLALHLSMCSPFFLLAEQHKELKVENTSSLNGEKSRNPTVKVTWGPQTAPFLPVCLCRSRGWPVAVRAGTTVCCASSFLWSCTARKLKQLRRGTEPCIYSTFHARGDIQLPEVRSQLIGAISQYSSSNVCCNVCSFKTRVSAADAVLDGSPVLKQVLRIIVWF